MLDLILKFGIGATPMAIGYLLYEKNTLLGGFCVVTGLLLIITFVISEVAYKHKELYARTRGFID